MIFLEMNADFIKMFPTISENEFIALKEIVITKNFKNKDEMNKWLILKQIDKPNLSLYIRSMYAVKLKGIVEKQENEHTEHGMKPYVLSNTQLAHMTGLSRDAIDKIVIIDKEATIEQHNKLLNNSVTMNKIYYELKPEQKRLPKEKEVITHKKCSDCGQVKPISKFYKGRAMCKVCYNNKDYSASRVKDVKGNVILSTDKVKELSRRYSDKIETDLYDADREMKYTINDMEDEINALINYFERNIGNCINLHASLLNSEENKQRIIETVQKVEESIKLIKGRLNNE